jgi:hypothetical protein
MKSLFFIAVLINVNHLFSQVISGDIYQVNRRLLTESTFKIESDMEGEIIYDISVDIFGKVKSAIVVPSLTTIKSTPLKMDAKNFVSTLKFEPGNGYPKFHHGFVKVTFVKKK